MSASDAYSYSPSGEKKSDSTSRLRTGNQRSITRCWKCNQAVSQGVAFKGEIFHRECFTCVKCDACLAGQKFINKDCQPFCNNCFGELFAKRCANCREPITGFGDILFIYFDHRDWHIECFDCDICGSSLVGELSITNGERIICTECAATEL